MKRERPLRVRLLAPLVYLAALLLMLEDWLWDLGAAFLGWLAGWPPLRAFERFLAGLPPWAALVCFLAPGLALFPIKLLALWAMTQGHALLGLSVIIVAKVVGAAAVARLYLLTKPALLSLAWFRRWHDAFMALKERWIGRLRATRAMRELHALRLQLRQAVRAAVDRLLRRVGRRRSRLGRGLRRFVSQWRARRRAQHSA
ncbi:hypothetical protein [Massilia sp. TS11]|uniref:hypothetical protein n=1 Tax=Massilia sp. TS11 TaxID=2908003 RepID=UPI001EDC7E0B|nr:hypothetical protein [Massilia sp. TS11]MCG2582894.1 hypothetical protein [Massilia sp. TS11]